MLRLCRFSVLNYSSQLSELLSQSSYSSLILVKLTSLANKLVNPMEDLAKSHDRSAHER
jgi:hypothetical protein